MPITRTRVLQGASAQLTGTVSDAAGTAVPGSRVSSVLLTLYALDVYDIASPVDGIINSRENVEVFTSSPAAMAITEAGAFTLTLAPADNAILNGARQVERHIASLVFTFDTGTYVTTQEVDVAAVKTT